MEISKDFKISKKITIELSYEDMKKFLSMYGSSYEITRQISYLIEKFINEKITFIK